MLPAGSLWEELVPLKLTDTPVRTCLELALATAVGPSTLTLPVIDRWIWQWKLKVPAEAKMWLNVSVGASGHDREKEFHPTIHTPRKRRWMASRRRGPAGRSRCGRPGPSRSRVQPSRRPSGPRSG